MKSIDISNDLVLGTAQFGMDYGITNVSGQPTKKEVFNILSLAWEKGVRRFDTAPGYGSEELLGKFIAANGLHDEIKVLTKIPALNNPSDYSQAIKSSVKNSINLLDCSIDVLFLHSAADSDLLMGNPSIFERILQDYPISTLGVSVYEPEEVENLSGCQFELAFQFPFNLLDRRFENVSMTKGKRFARSIFLQGLLATPNGLRINVPTELLNLQKEYHDKLADHFIDPISFSVSFAAINDAVDYFLIGVDSKKQLEHILNLDSYNHEDLDIFDSLSVNIRKYWLDPRNWS